MALAAVVFSNACLLSCSSEGVQERVDRRTAVTSQVDQNMRIRRDARDERHEQYIDRAFNKD